MGNTTKEDHQGPKSYLAKIAVLYVSFFFAVDEEESRSMRR